MPRSDQEMGLMPSLIDRLTDPDSGGTAWRRGYGVEQMIEVVRRDLEELLNTRRSTFGMTEAYTEVNNSIIAFGLPDLTALDAFTDAQREEIGRQIEATVNRFEPRLKDVRAVLLLDDASLQDRSVKFRIDARMRVDPAPEVAFDTVLELMTGRYSVKQNSA